MLGSGQWAGRMLASLLLAALARPCGAPAGLSDLAVTVDKLAVFMAEPFIPLQQSTEAYNTRLLDVEDTGEMQAWLLHQMLLHEERDEREGYMLYLGRPDGTFVGYMYAFRGIVYEVDGSTYVPIRGDDGKPLIDLVYTHRFAGQSPPQAHEWEGPGNSAAGSWQHSPCAMGIDCDAPADTYLAESCPVTGNTPRSCSASGCTGDCAAECAQVGMCALTAGSSCAPPGLPAGVCKDSDVRLYSRTDGGHRPTNIKPSWYSGDILIDYSLQSAADCQRLCSAHPACDYFSYEWEATNGAYWHECFMKDGFADGSCSDPYVDWSGGGGHDWAGASGPAQCSGCPASDPTCCIQSCKDYGGGGACGYATVLRIVTDRENWILPPHKWRNYDPRLRPWYIAANESLSAVSDARGSLLAGGCVGATSRPVLETLERWSDPYTFSTTKQSGLTATRALLDRNNELVGVLAVDYSLDLISRWLGAVFYDSSSSVVFVVERHTGRLIGSSTSNEMGSTETSLVVPVNSTNILIRAAARWLSLQSWSPPDNCERCTGSGCGNCTEVDSPPEAWLRLNPVVQNESSSADTVRRMHLSAANLRGASVRNLEWVVVTASIELEGCAQIHMDSGGNLMEPDANLTRCVCRRGYRPLDLSKTGDHSEGCSFCGQSDSLCSGGYPCIECFGGDKVFAKKGFWIQPDGEEQGVYNCSSRRCLGPVDVVDARSEADLCGGPDRAVSDGQGNCCAPGHSGKLCAVCDEGWSWSIEGLRCVRCEDHNYTRLVSMLVMQLLLVFYITFSKHFSAAFSWRIREGEYCPSFDAKKLKGTDVGKGTEIAALSFWVQTFNMLGADKGKGYMWVVYMIFSMEAVSDTDEGEGACLLYVPGDPVESFFIRASIDLWMGPVWMLFCVFVWDVILHVPLCNPFSKGACADIEHHWLHLKAILLDVALYCMTPLLSKSQKMWYCTSRVWGRDGEDDSVPYAHSVLQNAPFVECSGANYYSAMIVGVTLLVVLGFLFPIWLWRQLRIRRDVEPFVRLLAKHEKKIGTEERKRCGKSSPTEDKLREVLLSMKLSERKKRAIDANASPEEVENASKFPRGVWNDADASARDWLVMRYAHIRQEAWWWTAAEMLRRTFTAQFFSRRNMMTFDHEGFTKYDGFIGTMDWRGAIVVLLSINLFLSSWFSPCKNEHSNVHADLSLHILTVLYVLAMGNEENFFIVVVVLAATILGPSMIYVMVEHIRNADKAKRRNVFRRGATRVAQHLREDAISFDVCHRRHVELTEGRMKATRTGEGDGTSAFAAATRVLDNELALVIEAKIVKLGQFGIAMGLLPAGEGVEDGENLYKANGACFYGLTTGKIFPSEQEGGDSWEGMQTAEQGDTLQFTYQPHEGSLRMAKNGVELGTLRASGLTERYRFAVSMRSADDCVEISAKPLIAVAGVAERLAPSEKGLRSGSEAELDVELVPP